MSDTRHNHEERPEHKDVPEPRVVQFLVDNGDEVCHPHSQVERVDHYAPLDSPENTRVSSRFIKIKALRILQ